MSAPRVVTNPDAVTRAAADAPVGARVPVEVTVDVVDPFVAYRRAREGDAAGGVFLETTGGQPGWGYFGVDPVERLTVGPNAAAIAREGPTDEAGDASGAAGDARDDEPTASTDAVTPGATSPTLAALEGLLAGETLARGDCDVPYPCGVVGWLSYDVARELESLPSSAVDDRGLPRLEVGLFDRLAAWEEPAGDGPIRLRITACPRVDGEPHAAFERGKDRALDLAEAVLRGDSAVGSPPVDTVDATFESDCGREAFADRVRRVKSAVRDGDTFQANVSQRLVAPAAVHPVEAYAALRRVNPAPYSCLLEARSLDLVSASPELLLEREGALVRTEPIAGTRPRGETPADDRALEADLLGDEKERAEHAMLVDLERNDLGTVAQFGSVEVAEYRRVDRYAEVMHLVSEVRARLREGTTLADALAAVFPGGTITGAPKPRTMELIDELEATRRGTYTGGVGIFGFDGRATVNILIRTLVRHADEYHLRAGAGIVHDSDPHREYDETLDKARALIAAIDEALGDRAELAVEAGAGEAGGVERGGDSG